MIKTKTKTIKSISKYLAFIKADVRTLAFRGQGQDWPLLPSIARCNAYASGGIKKLEQFSISIFKRYSVNMHETSIKNKTDWILHAQHYGLPTRLLDLTTNPLKALFFAVEDLRNTNDAVVYGIDEYGEEDDFPSLEENYVQYYRPPHLNARIIAQESIFAVFPIGSEEDSMPALDKRKNEETRLYWKIYIPYKYKKEIKEELSYLGINKMSIYPGIEGIVAKVKEELLLD